MDVKDELLSEKMYRRRVDLTRLPAVYSPITDRSMQIYRMRALVFCLLSQFLSVNGDNDVGFSFIGDRTNTNVALHWDDDYQSGCCEEGLERGIFWEPLTIAGNNMLLVMNQRS